MSKRDRSIAAKKATATRKRRAAGKKAAAIRKHRTAGFKASATRKHLEAGRKAAATKKANARARKRSEAAKKANETRKRNAAMQEPTADQPRPRVDKRRTTLRIAERSFAVGDIVSIENDDPNWDEETVIGIVVKTDGNRMKVKWVDPPSETRLSWLTMHAERIPNRWIDDTYRAIVRVEEASASQRDAFLHLVPPERLARLIESER